ncbi:biopolymer transport protein ExbB [Verrucomicrobium sp. GAS474]|uniref:MotA/TolQ/ExbB proton channel family protein n=1 Tax=Verrucomicrobium sp. GAS474 TaxID=1882831 RepID=UPI00087D0210|nr:MotA/TolQ/ExbB proton channel family protein [Verrucomicrobium sp. GAS474]SDT91298.1 biopolymer transport protein ExbB [Verrucomicrobium sp. GAS474]
MMNRLSLRHLLFLLVLAVGVVGLLELSAPALHAQEAAATAGDTIAPKAVASDKTLMHVITHSGFAVWICAILSIVVTGFIIEGFLKLRFEALAPKAQLARLQELISYGSYQEAWQFCEENRSFLARVVGVALERIGRGHEAVTHALDEVSSQQAVMLKANMNYLSVIGVVTPMIGLTGTVIGMISAFNSLGASGIGDPSGLAAAIGEVLTSTAAGLIVAIPGFLFFYVFKNKAQTAIMMADFAIYRLFENIPYEHVAGMVVGQPGGGAFENGGEVGGEVVSA